MTGQPWQGGKLRVQRSRRAKQAVVPFPTFCPSQSHAAVGGHPHPPWEHRGVNPGVNFKSHPPPQYVNVDLDTKETHFKETSQFLREGFASFKILLLLKGGGVSDILLVDFRDASPAPRFEGP